MKHFLPLLILTGLLFGQDEDKPKTVISKTITKFKVEEKFGELKFVPSEKTTYEYVLLNNNPSQSLEQKKNQRVENSLNDEAHQYIKFIKDSRLRNLLLRTYGFKDKEQKRLKDGSDEVKFIPYDDPPQPIKEIRPVYPQSAQDIGAEGTVIILAFISANGKLLECEVLKGTSFLELDIAAIEAIYKTTFKPAKQGKNRMGVWFSIPVNFRLK